MLTRRLLSLTLLCILASGCTPDPVPADPAQPTVRGPVAIEEAPPSGKAVWISDIHFDPFYPAHHYSTSDTASVRALLRALTTTVDDSVVWRSHTEWDSVFTSDANQGGAWSVRNQDANHKLFQEVVVRAAATEPDPDFVLVTGDFLGHDFPKDYDALAPATLVTSPAYRAFVDETMQYIATTLRGAFTSAPIVATLGNNDAFCGDYDVRTDTSATGYLSRAAALVQSTLLPGLSPADRDSFAVSFARGGNYAIDVPGAPGNRLVVLNSVPFMPPGDYPRTLPPSVVATQACAGEPVVDPEAALDLLTREAGGSGHVWVAMHVPPGTGCYSTSTDWQPSVQARYEALLRPADSSAIAGAFAAHSHMASFKVFEDDGKAASFVLQAPSVSPNHANNATFSVFEYDPADLAISDLTVHYLDLDVPTATWASYPFGGLPGPVTAVTLKALLTRLGSSSAAWNTFVLDYGARANASATASGPVSLGDLSQQSLDCLRIPMARPSAPADGA